MAGRSPGPGQQPVADSLSGEEAPTSHAELHIMLGPGRPSSPDDASDPGQEIQVAAALPGRRPLILLGRNRLAAGARLAVPAANTTEMLGTVRTMVWAPTVVITVVATTAAGWPAVYIIGLVALELLGFVAAIRVRCKLRAGARPRGRDHRG
jgi:hypothetical protein